MSEISSNSDYRQALADIKQRIQAAWGHVRTLLTKVAICREKIVNCRENLMIFTRENI